MLAVSRGDDIMRAGLILSASFIMAASPVLAAGPTDAIFKVERDFAAYTRTHGYNQGFFTYSAPEAVDFEPQAHKVHDELGAAVAADPSDQPSKLIWWPYRASVASSGDLAWDMGPWKIDGTDKAGWFMTIWKKQPDGNWRWILDGGAGPDAADKLPPDGAQETQAGGASGGTAAAAETATKTRDGALDAALATTGGDAAYKGFYIKDMAIAAGDMARPATGKKDVSAMFDSRPKGAQWVLDGSGASEAGDLTYTYGHASAADGTYLGHYVRMWRKFGKGDDGWVVVFDGYQSAK